MDARFRAFLIGLVAGAVLPPFAIYLGWAGGLAALVLAIVAVLLRPRPAGAAGFLLPFGGWWLSGVLRAVDRCAAMNRQPNAFCEMPNQALDLALPILCLGVGLALTLVTFLANNPKRGGAGGRET